MTPTSDDLLGDTRRSRLLVLDSGVGGLAYIRRLLRIRNAYDVYYVADTAGFPYGEKPPDHLQEHLLRLVGEALLRFPADIALIACNTASVTALDALRERYTIPFVGTVPAVKPAVAMTRTGTIALLATSATVGDDYTDRLIDTFAEGYQVVRSGAPELVRRIEGGFPHLSETSRVESLVRTELSSFAAAGADVVVLGCTHFLHITELLERIARELGVAVQLVDSLDGVARRVVALTRAEQLPTVTGILGSVVKPGRGSGARPPGLRGIGSGGNVTAPPSTESCGVIVTTGFRDSPAQPPEAERYREIGKAFRLEYGGVLEL